MEKEDKKEKPKKLRMTTTRVLLLLLIFIITFFTLIFVYKVIVAQIETLSYRIVIYICILISYAVVIIIPIRGLYNPELELKSPPAGEKGPRGARGLAGKDGACNSCADNSLCYKKIMFEITKAYNWWRQQKKLPLYPDNYIIKNEYLKFKVNQHCKSDEFKKILVKYGANNDGKGAYDYMFRMWTIWILIILKYKSGVYFLESESLDETDFINLLSDEVKSDPTSVWSDMFPGDAGDAKDVKINYKHLVSSTEDGVGVESQLTSEGLDEEFFNKNGVPDNTKTPFFEIKNYKSWYWGADPYSKPDVIIESILPENELEKRLKLSCSNWSDDSSKKIKVMKTNDFFTLFKTDNTAEENDGSSYIPFQQLGSEKVTFLRANEFIDSNDHPLFRTYKPLGDLLFLSSDVKKYQFEPNKCYPKNLVYSEINKVRLTDELKTILVSGDVKSPTRYELVYHYKIENGLNKNYTNFRIWKPIAPEGYVALGYVVDTSPYNNRESSPPSTDLIWCLNQAMCDNLNDDYIDDNFWSNKPNSSSGVQGGKWENETDETDETLKKNNILNLFYNDDLKDSSDNIKTIVGITNLNDDIPENENFCKKYDKYDNNNKAIQTPLDECSKNSGSGRQKVCESNYKCEFKEEECKYKERNLQDLEKYSITRIYK